MVFDHLTAFGVKFIDAFILVASMSTNGAFSTDNSCTCFTEYFQSHTMLITFIVMMLLERFRLDLLVLLH